MNGKISAREGATTISVEATPATWAQAAGVCVFVGMILGVFLAKAK